MKAIKKQINDLLKEKLLQYGFRKKDNVTYYRISNDTIQELVFVFSANGEKKVSYLSYTASFICLDIEEMASKWGESIGYIGVNVGSLMPKPCYKEWRFTVDCSDEYIWQALDEVMFTVSHYAIPYLEKFSIKEKIAYGLETGTLSTVYDMTERWLPLYYISCGKNDRACMLVDEAIRRRTLDFPMNEYKAMQAIYGEEAIQIPPNKALESYLPFAEKFKQMIESEKA